MRRKKIFLIALIVCTFAVLIVGNGIASNSNLRSEIKQEVNILFSQASFQKQLSVFSNDETFLEHISRLKNVLSNSIKSSTRLEY